MSPESSISSELPLNLAVGRVPAIEGWFTLDEYAPALLGTHCTTCGTYVFPPDPLACPNPYCGSHSAPKGVTFETVELSRRGRIWSYTDSRYEPPPPYVAADPYVPFCLAAVELAKEKLVVLGQVAPGFTVDDLCVGMEVELVLANLNSGSEGGPGDLAAELVWNWRPVRGAGAAEPARAESNDR